MSKGKELPYPKRLKDLIQSYQVTNSPDDFKKILLLIDKLLIRIIHQIYSYETFSYLRKHEANEIYHTAILALGKSLKTFDVNEGFTINKFSSRLNGYIAREFSITFSSCVFYVGFDDILEGQEQNVESEKDERTIDDIFDNIKKVKPSFPDRGVEALKLHLSEKMSLQEIADKMGVKKGCIRSWVDRGKKILRSMIEKERKQDLWH